MILNKRLVAIVTGFLLIAGRASPGMGAPSWDQLTTIDAYLSQNDTRGLLQFLAVHPELMQGEDELAAELRSFAAEMGRTDVSRFNAQTSTIDATNSAASMFGGGIY
ncbi:hypothetical protein ACP2AV_09710 [Aliiroseovarius sp. PTFE2010]|uniref:hypothetical protein n=1 Tax=Aliiroseovarius sp. PTFE2010 TaxID=3417190 RepID=UPI003CED0BD4